MKTKEMNYTDADRTDCCGAMTTYDKNGELYCKACLEEAYHALLIPEGLFHSTQTALVHTRGKRFETVKVVQGIDWRIYARHHGRWWMLSKPSETVFHGQIGWRSYNVGMPDGFNPTTDSF